ncbi:hypothetical protein SLOPH_928 [Spraguea lophii 42_110]|uniref:Uncharacterized protein n=1 Tax=Spraguea lophii (strain 42_110) TaxID=1358809 RepID=S7W853_SPRLO|nr:hypothetical protein SLOPH_928 [Spraguea lophii 42_110]
MKILSVFKKHILRNQTCLFLLFFDKTICASENIENNTIISSTLKIEKLYENPNDNSNLLPSKNEDIEESYILHGKKKDNNSIKTYNLRPRKYLKNKYIKGYPTSDFSESFNEKESQTKPTPNLKQKSESNKVQVLPNPTYNENAYNSLIQQCETKGINNPIYSPQNIIYDQDEIISQIKENIVQQQQNQASFDKSEDYPDIKQVTSDKLHNNIFNENDFQTDTSKPHDSLDSPKHTISGDVSSSGKKVDAIINIPITNRKRNHSVNNIKNNKFRHNKLRKKIVKKYKPKSFRKNNNNVFIKKQNFSKNKYINYPNFKNLTINSYDKNEDSHKQTDKGQESDVHEVNDKMPGDSNQIEPLDLSIDHFRPSSNENNKVLIPDQPHTYDLGNKDNVICWDSFLTNMLKLGRTKFTSMNEEDGKKREYYIESIVLLKSNPNELESNNGQDENFFNNKDHNYTITKPSESQITEDVNIQDNGFNESLRQNNNDDSRECIPIYPDKEKSNTEETEDIKKSLQSCFYFLSLSKGSNDTLSCSEENYKECNYYDDKKFNASKTFKNTRQSETRDLSSNKDNKRQCKTNTNFEDITREQKLSPINDWSDEKEQLNDHIINFSLKNNPIDNTEQEISLLGITNSNAWNICCEKNVTYVPVDFYSDPEILNEEIKILSPKIKDGKTLNEINVPKRIDDTHTRKYDSDLINMIAEFMEDENSNTFMEFENVDMELQKIFHGDLLDSIFINDNNYENMELDIDSNTVDM